MYKRGCHPNTLRNLRPFQKGHDPWRWTGGGRSSVQHRQVRFQAVAAVLISESLDPELREQALDAACRAIIEGAIAGDPVLLRRVFEGAMRGWW